MSKRRVYDAYEPVDCYDQPQDYGLPYYRRPEGQSRYDPRSKEGDVPQARQAPARKSKACRHNKKNSDKSRVFNKMMKSFIAGYESSDKAEDNDGDDLNE